MKAVLYEEFEGHPKISTVADPTPVANGVVIKVMATGLCRSDWHGWKGDDPDITLPHVPGHELAGIVEAVGANVKKWKAGDRVTLPFVGGCGACTECFSGNHQVCDAQFQPGFTHWGSFAEYVSIHYADTNLVALPDEIDFAAAAILGCRMATSWRAVVDQGGLMPGEWVAVHGCGGVGLAAIMIATALGARVVAVDINDKALALAKDLGAVSIVNAITAPNIGEAVKDITNGGAHLSIEAIGDKDACFSSISSLRKRGRHIQVGIFDAEDSNPNIPLARVIANELKIIGSHGMQAHRYHDMINMILIGKLSPEKLITKRISLDQAAGALANMSKPGALGITLIDSF